MTFSQLLKNEKLPGLGSGRRDKVTDEGNSRPGGHMERLGTVLRWPFYVAMLTGIFYAMGFFEPVEMLTQDARFLVRQWFHPFASRSAVQSYSSDIVVVGITKDCIQKYGDLPWDRRRYARAVEKLNGAGAATIVFDLYFPLPADDPQADQELMDAIREAGNVILPVYCPIALSMYEGGPVQEVDDLSLSYEAITEAALASAHINVPESSDRKVRSFPLALRHEGTLYYNLGVEGAWRYMNSQSRENQYKPWFSASPLNELPITSDGTLWINYRERTSLTVVPFHKLMDPDFLETPFRGKLVFVGQTLLGRQNSDTVNTPLGKMHGVAVQAAAADNALKNRFLVRQPFISVIVTILVVSFISGIALWRLPPLKALLLWTAGLLALFLVAIQLFTAANIAIDVVPLLAVLSGNFIVALPSRLKKYDEIVQRRDTEIATIEASGRLSSAEIAADRTPETLITLIARTMNADIATLSLRSQPVKTWYQARRKQQRSSGQAVLTREKVEAFEASAQSVTKTLNALCLSADPSRDERFQKIPPLPAALAIVPLIVGQQHVGLLSLYKEHRHGVSAANSGFHKDEIQLLKVLSQQAALTLSNSLLIEDLQEKNVELTHTMDELKKAQDEIVTREKLSAVGRMAAMIIHDIRGPLTVLMGYAGLIRGRPMSQDDADRLSETIDRETRRINEMVSEILDFVQGRKNLQKREVGVAVLLDELRIRFNGDTTEETQGEETEVVTVKAPSGLVVTVDREKILRVFHNLCRNALEAAGEDGRVTIECSVNDEEVQFVVADNGPGIPEDIIDKVFEPFVTKGKKKGTGLGLAIVQKIVQDHDGSISVESEVGKGTRFTITLPAAVGEA